MNERQDVSVARQSVSGWAARTRAFSERMSSSPELAMGLASRRRLLCWEGGLPITPNGTVIGGIGVSGATGPEDALSVLGLGLQEA